MVTARVAQAPPEAAVGTRSGSRSRRLGTSAGLMGIQSPHQGGMARLVARTRRGPSGASLGIRARQRVWNVSAERHRRDDIPCWGDEPRSPLVASRGHLESARRPHRRTSGGWQDDPADDVPLRHRPPRRLVSCRPLGRSPGSAGRAPRGGLRCGDGGSLEAMAHDQRGGLRSQRVGPAACPLRHRRPPCDRRQSRRDRDRMASRSAAGWSAGVDGFTSTANLQPIPTACLGRSARSDCRRPSFPHVGSGAPLPRSLRRADGSRRDREARAVDRGLGRRPATVPSRHRRAPSGGAPAGTALARAP